MKALPNLALLAVALAFITITFAIGADAVCLSSGSRTCQVWHNFQWESITAGALGLMGGIFVIASTRQQIQAQREDMANAELREVDALLHKVKTINLSIDEFLSTSSHMRNTTPNQEWKSIIEEWEIIRTDHPESSLHTDIQHNKLLPRPLKRLSNKIDQLTRHLNSTVFNNIQDHEKTIAAITKLKSSWEETEELLEHEREKHADSLLHR